MQGFQTELDSSHLQCSREHKNLNVKCCSS
uniref:Uncharacterized protein n=1 Tax=Anguilla anguilla TaxID=7936 RepID=A0A0E9TCY0_ANGAN